MSQQSVESILGRLITDADFRDRFLAESAFVCREHSFDLTPTELSALLSIETRALQSMMATLDPRIVRAVVVRSRRGSRGSATRARVSRERRRQRHAF